MMMRRLAMIWLTLVAGASLWTLFQGAPRFDLPLTLSKPTTLNWFGHDTFGRSIGELVARAALVSLTISALAATVICALSVLFAGALPLMSTRSRAFFQSVLDSFLVFPSLLLGLALAAFRGPGYGTLLVALTVGSVPEFTRLLSARAQELAREPFIEAARAAGATRTRLLFRHIVPHLLGLAWVKVPALVGTLLIAEATLSFLGIGTPAGSDTWGKLLAQGKDYLIEAPHIALGSGIPLVLTIFSIQVFSESRELR